MPMETVVDVAYMVLLVGGALCVLVLLVMLVYVMLFMIKAKHMVDTTQKTYEQAMYYALSPLQKLTTWLWEEVEEDEEDDDR